MTLNGECGEYQSTRDWHYAIEKKSDCADTPPSMCKSKQLPFSVNVLGSRIFSINIVFSHLFYDWFISPIVPYKRLKFRSHCKYKYRLIYNIVTVWKVKSFSCSCVVQLSCMGFSWWHFPRCKNILSTAV